MRLLHRQDKQGQTLIAHDFGNLGYPIAHEERLLVSQGLSLQAHQYLIVLRQQEALRYPCPQ